MISERKLVSSHSSFWRNAMPMADAFVRNMNVSLQRAFPPRPAIFKGYRNALISELSFRLYSHCLNETISLDKLLKNIDQTKIIVDEVYRYISRLERTVIPIPIMEAAEIDESFELAKNLHNFMRFTNPGRTALTRPKFTGCGIVDDCEGDILVDTTLYELKNVERDFRLADIRQLLTYCALNFASRQREIDTVGLVNAKSGRWYKIKLNDLALSTSGMPANELLGEVIRYITVDTPSR